LMESREARGRVAHPDHRKTYAHDVITNEALKLIRAHKDEPFLLNVHWTIPHTNNEGGRVTGDGQEVPEYGIYGDKDWPSPERGFAAMVSRMDRDVGRIVGLLGDLGIERRTLVLFTSDNGPHQEGGHKHAFFDSNGPLRGYKRDLYEGGIRVPTIAWWPGVVPRGGVSDEPLAFYDFLPTACQLAGIEIPGKIDGQSFVPTLLGRPAERSRREYLFFKYGNKVTAVRKGKWKFLHFSPKNFELYDLSIDIGEKNDVADRHPELVRRMKDIIREATAR